MRGPILGPESVDAGICITGINQHADLPLRPRGHRLQFFVEWEERPFVTVIGEALIFAFQVSQ